MAQLNFNAQTVAPDAGRPEPVPAGWYNVAIDESEMKPTKDGSGAYLQLRFNILDGQYAGRKVFQNLNLRNANPVAQQIAYGQLSAICHATGVIQCQDSQQLHGIPIKVKVKVREDKTGQYDPQNEISAYKNVNDPTAINGPSAGAPAMQPAMAGAPAGFGAPTMQPQMPASQPWAAQPQAQPQPQMQPQPAMQPQMQPAMQPQQAWQQPAAQQPWTQGQPQQPAMQPQPQMQPQAQPPMPPAGPSAQAQTATPPWMQQPGQ